MNIFTITCLQPGTAPSLLYQRADTDAANTSLGQMSRELDDLGHTALIWDPAGYYTAEGLKVPSNISLIGLP